MDYHTNLKILDDFNFVRDKRPKPRPFIMFQFHMRKIMLVILSLTVLFVIYQLSFSESLNVSPKDNHLANEYGKSLDVEAMPKDILANYKNTLTGQLSQNHWSASGHLWPAAGNSKFPSLYFYHKCITDNHSNLYTSYCWPILWNKIPLHVTLYIKHAGNNCILRYLQGPKVGVYGACKYPRCEVCRVLVFCGLSMKRRPT